MAKPVFNPVFTGEGRVFINEEGYGGGTKFKYHNNMKIDGLDRSLGDYEPVYLPDPNNYDEFVEVGSKVLLQELRPRCQGSYLSIPTVVWNYLPIEGVHSICKFTMVDVLDQMTLQRLKAQLSSRKHALRTTISVLLLHQIQVKEL
jgi:hypothetical protein